MHVPVLGLLFINIKGLYKCYVMVERCINQVKCEISLSKSDSDRPVSKNNNDKQDIYFYIKLQKST